ncbi:MAG: FGGY family carbohydrate kinase, partial [Christensenellales bacterium]
LEGSVFVGGAVLQWLRDEMKLISHAKEADEISEKCPDTGGVYIVPAFVGLGAPHWQADARGTVCGITRGTKREHFVRAALESIAYQVFDVVHAMENDLNQEITGLNVDGGACVSNVLMQFQADLLKADVVRPKVVETTALGACYLAGLGVGVWKSVDDIKTDREIDRVFSPSMQEDRREKLIMGWLESVARAKYQ